MHGGTLRERGRQRRKRNRRERSSGCNGFGIREEINGRMKYQMMKRVKVEAKDGNGDNGIEGPR